MTKNQGQTYLIFEHAMHTTRDFAPILSCFQMKRPRIELEDFWAHLSQNLEIDSMTQLQAARLVWKLATKSFKISKNLLYKLSTVCLILAEKLCQDKNNTLESYSLISGVSMNDLKNLEIEVLEILDFDLHLKDFEVEALPSYLKF